tara:strand:+ start:827 stop:1162 length:336 start_codon:yes stop_codon:yes gene_type:complete
MGSRLKKLNSICADISCNEKLPPHYIEWQLKRKKYRFCVKCRHAKTASPVWLCIGCGCQISKETPLGKYYCKSTCPARLESRRKAERIRRRIKLVAEAHIYNKKTPKFSLI